MTVFTDEEIIKQQTHLNNGEITSFIYNIFEKLNFHNVSDEEKFNVTESVSKVLDNLFVNGLNCDIKTTRYFCDYFIEYVRKEWSDK